RVTLRRFRMARTGVVLFENRMMNDGRRHLRSISHIRRSSIEELLRQISIEALQNDVFSLSAGFIALVDVEQSQVVMRGRIIVLESDGGVQLLGRHEQTMHAKICNYQSPR